MGYRKLCKNLVGAAMGYLLWQQREGLEETGEQTDFLEEEVCTGDPIHLPGDPKYYL